MFHKNLLSHLMDPESVEGLQEVVCYIPGGEWGGEDLRLLLLYL